MYDNCISSVSEITHVGILLQKDCNVKCRIELACKKIKYGVMEQVRSGVHSNALNPITSSKSIKQTVYAFALYGCEVWSLLNNECITMLERAQPFVVNSIQGFERQTRSDMANMAF